MRSSARSARSAAGRRGSVQGRSASEAAAAWAKNGAAQRKRIATRARETILPERAAASREAATPAAPFALSNRQSRNPIFAPANLHQHRLHEVRREEACASPLTGDERDHRLVAGAGHDRAITRGKPSRNGRDGDVESSHALALIARRFGPAGSPPNRSAPPP